MLYVLNECLLITKGLRDSQRFSRKRDKKQLLKKYFLIFRSVLGLSELGFKPLVCVLEVDIYT